jgi:serine/threonine-protein kinase
VGYWLLTGQTVFPSRAVTAVLMDHVRTPPLPPSHRVETPVPGEFERLILQCLEKEPARRPATAGELRRQLEPLSTGWDRVRAERWWRDHAPSRA